MNRSKNQAVGADEGFLQVIVTIGVIITMVMYSGAAFSLSVYAVNITTTSHLGREEIQNEHIDSTSTSNSDFMLLPFGPSEQTGGLLISMTENTCVNIVADNPVPASFCGDRIHIKMDPGDYAVYVLPSSDSSYYFSGDCGQSDPLSYHANGTMAAGQQLVCYVEVVPAIVPQAKLG